MQECDIGLKWINDLPDDAICNIAIYADDTTFYCKWEQASKFASDLLDWGKKWLVDFSAGKTRLDSFDRSSKSGANDVKMDGSVLEEK